MGKSFPEGFGDLFVRELHSTHIFIIPLKTYVATPGRCEELYCPLLALEVFGAYQKYQLKFTLAGGQRLLHSLTATSPPSSSAGTERTNL